MTYDIPAPTVGDTLEPCDICRALRCACDQGELQ